MLPGASILILKFGHGWADSPRRLVLAIAVTLGFALLARALRGVSRGGMIAGGGACFLLLAGAGPGAFAALATLFALTWTTTRLGHRRKQELGVAEKGDGRRAWQVTANLAAAALSAGGFAVSGNPAWLVAAAAALAEAATDTVASEVGQSAETTAILITTGKRVAAGTDGGVTLAGSVAGAAAGLVVVSVAALAGMIPVGSIWTPVAAGVAGMLLDSLLGATLQYRGWLTNEAVNLAGTFAAAALARFVA